MKRKNEQGAIVVEATISLTAFVFAIITILWMVNFAYTQAKIGVALNSAAKEISQYSYLYYKFEMDEMNASISANTETANQTARDTIDGVKVLIDSVGEAKDGLASFDAGKVEDAISSGGEAAGSVIKEYESQLSEDPKSLIMGMGKLALSTMNEEGKSMLETLLAKAFMKKNLRSAAKEDPDAFLIRHRIAGGMAGLDFKYSTLMPFGTSDVITLAVSYDMKIITLLNIDFKFKMFQVAKTQAWGNGISKLSPNKEGESPSLWKSMASIADRGKVITEKEITERGYEYLGDGKGFDAFDANKNEFVSVVSIDTTFPTTSDAKGITYEIKKSFSDMYAKVGKQKKNMTLKDSKGNSVRVSSDVDTRAYRMIVVVPEGTDPSVVDAAVKDLYFGDDKVEVEVLYKYGKGTYADTNNKSGVEKASA